MGRPASPSGCPKREEREMMLLGVILFVTPVVGIWLYYLLSPLYWAIRCYLKGGDWRYYAGKVVEMLCLTSILIGLGLILASC